MKKIEFKLDIKKLQQVQLQMLIEFDRICKENKLQYQLFSGTLLGAVRHKAFIAWDDDIDVAMLREDYETFLQICQEKLDEKYFLQTHETDKKYIHSFARIRKNNTLSVQKHWADIDMHHGIFIDVFPLDKISPESFKGKLQYHLLYPLRRLKFLKTNRDHLTTGSFIKRKLVVLARFLLKPFPTRSFNRLETRIMSMFENTDAEYSTCLSEGGKETYLPYMIRNDEFYDTIDMDFEGHKFPVPINYDEILTNNFGDYMTLPPIEEQKPHHGIIELNFDTNHSQTKITEIKAKEGHVVKLFLEIMKGKYKVKSDVKKLGGMNNDNYKIFTNSINFVFRLPGKVANESVNRASEFFNTKVAREIGIDCNTIYFDVESGVKITEYIKDAETLSIATAKEKDNMRLMAYALNRLHESKKKFYENFKPFLQIEEYKNTVIREKESLLEDYQELDRTVAFLKNKIEKIGLDHVPCHLDAWPENFVKTKDKIYLIDWEYSSNYDSLWDVVSIGLECEYSRAEEELFYKKYFGRSPSNSERLKMDVLKILMDIYWSMWSLSKVSYGEEEIHEYSLGRYNRGIANLKEFKRPPLVAGGNI